MHDDDDWPTGVPRHGEEAELFRRWRARHPMSSPGFFSAHGARREEEAAEEARRRPPLTPEQQREEWRRSHDDGYLDDQDRANLTIGVAPALNAKRIVRMATGPTAIVLFVFAYWTWSDGAPLVGWPLGLAIAGLALAVLAMYFDSRRPADRGPR